MDRFQLYFKKVLSFFRILTLVLVILTVVLGFASELLKNRPETSEIRSAKIHIMNLEVSNFDNEPTISENTILYSTEKALNSFELNSLKSLCI